MRGHTISRLCERRSRKNQGPPPITPAWDGPVGASRMLTMTQASDHIAKAAEVKAEGSIGSDVQQYRRKYRE